MSHDSRYEKECPKHGWYFDEEGCVDCEKESVAASPESLRVPVEHLFAASVKERLDQAKELLTAWADNYPNISDEEGPYLLRDTKRWLDILNDKTT